jgi:SAM-dependent methyltransferase
MSRTSDALLTAFYDDRAAEQGASSDPEAHLRFRRAVRAATLRDGEAVLDVGAKDGALAHVVRDAGIDVSYVGLDLAEANVRAGVAQGLDLRQADVTKALPVDDASFDCVFALELVEHVTSPLELLEEARRVLRPDGRLVVSVPSPYSWVEVLRELTGRHDTEGHVNAYTTPVVSNLLALAGLRLERRFGTFFRVPKTSLLIPTNSILARSRIYVARRSDAVRFAGRELTVDTGSSTPAQVSAES